MTTTNIIKNKSTNIHYGDIVWVDLGVLCGSEQGGTRPALVISNDKNNLHSPIISIVPLSSSKFKRDHKSYLPTHITISPNETGVSGIDRDSVVMCEQTRAIDKSRVISKSGHIENQYIIDALNRALTIHFGVV